MKPTHLKWIAAATVALTAVFCISFVFFFTRAYNDEGQFPSVSEKADTPLPSTNLFDASGTSVSDDVLHRGGVVLVFISLDCKACRTEAQFLRDVGNNPQLSGKVSYYGIVSFGGKDSLKGSEELFPFKLLYDDGAHLATQ